MERVRITQCHIPSLQLVVVGLVVMVVVVVVVAAIVAVAAAVLFFCYFPSFFCVLFNTLIFSGNVHPRRGHEDPEGK